MRQEAVRAVDGLADDRGDAHRDGRLRPTCGRVGGRLADGKADGRAHFRRSERPSATPRL